MDRVYSSGASVSPPTTPANPSVGFPTSGNPATGTVGTKQGAYWYHMIMEELLSVITAAGLTPAAGTLTQLASAIQTGKVGLAVAAGTADALTATFTPAITALTNGMPLSVRASVPNATTAPTFTPQPGVILAKVIVKGAGIALAPGDIAGAGHWVDFQYDQVLDKWVLLNPATGITTSQTSVQIQSLATPTVLNNALTLAWNPAPLQFRNTVLASGTPIAMSAPGAALSITIPSGATLGGVSGVKMVIAHLIAYNGGSPVSCVVNMAGGVDLSEAGLISPTTISAAATSASTIYSASAVAPNSPYRVVGYYVVTEVTAGVWAAAPALSQGAGGEAMAAMQAFGAGQKWIDFTGSRVFGTTYYNDTLKPITLKIACVGTSVSVTYLSVNISGFTVRFCYSGFNANATNTSDSLIIPAGCSYTVTTSSGGASLNSWYELR